MSYTGFDFITQFCDYMRDTESPDSFWRWSAIATVAAVLRDNVWLPLKIGNIYPNIYVLLHADSGIARKAAPLKFASKMIIATENTKFIYGRTSIQAALKELGDISQDSKGKPIKGASAVLYSEELSSFLVKDDATVDILTTIYDYHDKWRTNLIGAGEKELQKVCVTMLAATNASLMGSVFSQEAIVGGLLGRTFVVKETRARHKRSLFELTTASEPEYEVLVKHLRHLATIHGPLHFEAASQRYIIDWYHAIPDEVKADKYGFGARLETYVVKLAIILAASQYGFNKTITKAHIEAAIDLVTSIRKNYKYVGATAVSGKSNYSTQAALVLQLLLKQPTYSITRSVLIQQLLGEIEIDILDKIILMLVQGDLLVEEVLVTPSGGAAGYRLTQKGLAVLFGEVQ